MNINRLTQENEQLKRMGMEKGDNTNRQFVELQSRFVAVNEEKERVIQSYEQKSREVMTLTQKLQETEIISRRMN